ncbi:MAG: hypothetical protein AB1349_00140 [Elusimicrobiota bacterium]
MLRKLAIIFFVVFALLISGGTTFCFANTLNPNCPEEVKQAIQNWAEGLDERDVSNVQCPMSNVNKSRTSDFGLRTLFLTSLITLTFNTPIHSQIQLVRSLQKLFAVAKHYISGERLAVSGQRLVAIFVTLKKYFEKLFLLLLGKVNFATTFLFFLFYLFTFSLSHHLYYRFHNLRL